MLSNDYPYVSLLRGLLRLYYLLLSYYAWDLVLGFRRVRSLKS